MRSILSIAAFFFCLTGFCQDYPQCGEIVEQSAVRYIRVNMHFLRDDNGSNGFSETVGKQYALDLIEAANNALCNNDTMALYDSLAGPPEVLPVPFRYILYPDSTDQNDPDHDGIYFHNDSEVYYHAPLVYNCLEWYSGDSCLTEELVEESVFSGPYPVNRDISQQNITEQHVERYKSNADSILNIFFVEDHPDYIQVKVDNGQLLQVGGNAWGYNQVTLRGAYANYYNLDNRNPALGNGGVNHYAVLLNHEVGHVLGLGHAWAEDECSDTPPHPESKDGGSNNVMDYNGYMIAWTPCQLHTVLCSLKGSKKVYIIGQEEYDCFTGVQNLNLSDTTNPGRYTGKAVNSSANSDISSGNIEEVAFDSLVFSTGFEVSSIGSSYNFVAYLDYICDDGDFCTSSGSRLAMAENPLLESLGFFCSHGNGSYPFVRNSTYVKSEGAEKIRIKVIPNPFNSSTLFRIASNKEQALCIKVYNSFGQLVFSETGHYSGGGHEILFDGTQLPEGVYIYHVQAGATIESGKLVKAGR